MSTKELRKCLKSRATRTSLMALIPAAAAILHLVDIEVDQETLIVIFTSLSAFLLGTDGVIGKEEDDDQPADEAGGERE